jgi:hypothetical protein
MWRLWNYEISKSDNKLIIIVTQKSLYNLQGQGHDIEIVKLLGQTVNTHKITIGHTQSLK